MMKKNFDYTQFKKKHIYLIIMFLFLVLPFRIGTISFSNYLTLPMALLFSIFIITTSYNIGRKTFLFFVNLLIIGLIFAILNFIVFFVNSMNYQAILIKDFIEPIKPFFNVLFIFSGYLIAIYFSSEQITSFIIKFSIFSIFFSSLVYLPSFHPILDFFKGRPYSEDWSIIHYLRFSGFMGYPSVFGIWLCLTLLLVYNKYKNYQIKRFFIFSIIMTGILLTGSRTALVIVIISFLLNVIFVDINFSKFTIKKSLVKFLPVIITLVYVATLMLLVFSDFSTFNYIWRFIESGFQEGSFSHRVNEIDILLKEATLLGYGPNNYYLEDYIGPVESMYFYYIYKFGLVGGLYLMLIFIVVSLIIIKSKKINNLFGLIFGIWALVSLLIGGIAESVMDEYKSFFIFHFLLGFVIKELLSEKKIKLIDKEYYKSS